MLRDVVLLDPALHVDRVLTRNAEILVVLRHLIAEMHAGQTSGHTATASWTCCAHPSCRRVQQLVPEAGRAS